MDVTFTHVSARDSMRRLCIRTRGRRDHATLNARNLRSLLCRYFCNILLASLAHFSFARRALGTIRTDKISYLFSIGLYLPRANCALILVSRLRSSTREEKKHLMENVFHVRRDNVLLCRDNVSSCANSCIDIAEKSWSCETSAVTLWFSLAIK